jgi:hypothetical protein
MALLMLNELSKYRRLPVTSWSGGREATGSVIANCSHPWPDSPGSLIVGDLAGVVDNCSLPIFAVRQLSSRESPILPTFLDVPQLFA